MVSARPTTAVARAAGAVRLRIVMELAAAVVGAAATVLGLRVVLTRLRGDRHVRENFRGREVVAAGGAALVAPLVAGGVIGAFADRPTVALTMLGAGLLTAALGFVDDVFGDRSAGGLVGHARAFLRGQVTTGLLKAGGGAILGLATAIVLGWRGPWGIAAGAVVALASNMVNLFDLRPGRAIKLWLPLAAWCMFSSALASGRVVVAAVGAGAIVFLVADLRERVMLGDTGAGLLGVVLGVAAVAIGDRTAILVLLGVLLVLTLASEKVRFSAVIEAVPPLRWLDGLGRRAG
jgi:UDP-GlcNAc:undecaprenyl-phosphate/decaprenyl-phosphate GlcNAc-1-phosphate transferase